MNINKILYLSLVLFLNIFNVFCSTTTQCESGVSSPLNLQFKIGFEFQEVNGLCPWAIADARIQKKPIFSLNKILESGPSIRPLWHVELDTNDIEFVTEPFSYEEKALLNECVKTIFEAVNALKELLNKGDKEGILFLSWVDELSGTYTLREDIMLQGVNRDIVSEKLITSRDRLDGKQYKPHFTPQFTLQHPLESSIFLYFGLFGGKNPRDVLRFISALPFRDFLIKSMEDAKSEYVSKILGMYSQKLTGLVFLHALTLASLCPDDDPQVDPLESSAERFKTSFQVDAKSKLTLMSRRPFSQMYHDLPDDCKVVAYPEIMKNYLFIGNERFRYSMNSFVNTNYGEQFFDENGGPLDLRKYLRLFNLIPQGLNSSNILYLLENGILTTNMLSYIPAIADDMKKNMEQYAKEVIDISKPRHRRLKLDVKSDKPSFIVTEEEIDALSPPWFLENSDSMGRIRGSINLSYGEAIVEIRGISGLGSWFFERALLGEDEDKTYFLSDFERFEKHTMALFDYLNKLTFRDFHDIAEGIRYLLLKY